MMMFDKIRNLFGKERCPSMRIADLLNPERAPESPKVKKPRKPKIKKEEPAVSDKQKADELGSNLMLIY
jgi:hypothetical protein